MNEDCFIGGKVMDLQNRIKIKEMAIEERPREKMISLGCAKLSNAELLAIILRTGNKDMSVVDLSNKIINLDKIEGIRGLSNITVQELSKLKGVGQAKACQIVASIELGKRISKAENKSKCTVKSPQEISNIFMEELRYLKKEIFKILLLNTKNDIISDIDISIGSLNSSIVHPREVFIEAIKRSANKIILMHNHPSGNPKPSNEDKEITSRLVKTGDIVGIQILDHIIIGDGSYYSFKENSLIL